MRIVSGWAVGIIALVSMMAGIKKGMTLLGLDVYSRTDDIVGQGRYGEDLVSGGFTLEGMGLAALSFMIAIRVGMVVALWSWEFELMDVEDIAFLAWFYGLVAWTAVAILLSLAFRGAPSGLAPYVEFGLKVVTAVFMFGAARRWRKRCIERMMTSGK